jgi:mRNA interferase MazF
MIKSNIEKGDILYAILNPVIGSEQGGERPVVVIQNNLGNEYNPTIIVAPLTKKLKKKKLPMHIFIPKNSILRFDSQILLEQTRTIDKSRIVNYLGSLNDYQIQLIDNALIETFGIDIIGYLKFKGIGGNNINEREKLYSEYYDKTN